MLRKAFLYCRRFVVEDCVDCNGLMASVMCGYLKNGEFCLWDMFRYAERIFGVSNFKNWTFIIILLCITVWMFSVPCSVFDGLLPCTRMYAGSQLCCAMLLNVKFLSYLCRLLLFLLFRNRH